MSVWFSIFGLFFAQLSASSQIDLPTARESTAQRIADLRASLSASPGSQSVAMELARTLAKSAPTRQEAVAHYQALVRDGELSERQLAVVLYELAFCHEQLGQDEHSIKRLTELAKLEFLPVADAGVASGSAVQANSEWSRAMELRSKAIMRLASYYSDKRQDALAAEWLSRVERSQLSNAIYPNYALLLARNSIDCNRANKAADMLYTLDCYDLTKQQRTSLEFLSIQAAMQLRDFDQAEGAIENLTELARAETSQPDWMVTVSLRRVELALARKNHPLARELASQAAKQFPSFGRAYEFKYLQARAEIGSARFLEARELLQSVVESPRAAGTETAAKAQWMIGETYFLQQDFDQALHAYQQVLKDHSHAFWKSAAALQQAKCLEQLGRTSEAIELYQTTRLQFVGSQAAEQAAARLSELSGPELKANRR